MSRTLTHEREAGRVGGARRALEEELRHVGRHAGAVVLDDEAELSRGAVDRGAHGDAPARHLASCRAGT